MSFKDQSWKFSDERICSIFGVDHLRIIPSPRNEDNLGKPTRNRTNQNIRTSQIITTYGIGGIFTAPDGFNGGQGSFMISGLKEWERSLYGDEEDRNTYVPMVRFPTWYVCQNNNCKILRQFSSNTPPAKMKCDICEKKKKKEGGAQYVFHKMVPARFITICPNGHINDFPYYWYVHEGEACTKKGKAVLKLKNNAKTMQDFVHCTTCDKKKYFNISKVDGLLKEYGKNKCEADLFFTDGPLKDRSCKQNVITKLRTATGVTFLHHRSSIIIPNDTNPIKDFAIRYYGKTVKDYNNMKEANFFRDDNQAKDYINMQFLKLSDTYEDFNDNQKEKLIDMVFNNLSPGSASLNDEVDDEFVKQQEYNFFHEGQDTNFENIAKEQIKLKEASIRIIFDSIIRFDKIKLVQVLQSISRERDSNRKLNLIEDTKNINCPKGWLPCAVNSGEGIYFEFNKNIMDTFCESKLSTNILDELGQIDFSDYSPKKLLTYYVANTFSHIIMEELAYSSGIQATDIKERIYVVNDGDEIKSGVLLYTAKSDKYGTLGGLVANCNEKKLEEIITISSNKKAWCSSDPLCREEPMSKFHNKGCCNSCILVPDTSCETMNQYLYRDFWKDYLKICGITLDPISYDRRGTASWSEKLKNQKQ